MTFFELMNDEAPERVSPSGDDRNVGPRWWRKVKVWMTREVRRARNPEARIW